MMESGGEKSERKELKNKAMESVDKSLLTTLEPGTTVIFIISDTQCLLAWRLTHSRWRGQGGRSLFSATHQEKYLDIQHKILKTGHGGQTMRRYPACPVPSAWLQVYCSSLTFVF